MKSVISREGDKTNTKEGSTDDVKSHCIIQHLRIMQHHSRLHHKKCFPRYIRMGECIIYEELKKNKMNGEDREREREAEEMNVCLPNAVLVGGKKVNGDLHGI